MNLKLKKLTFDYDDIDTAYYFGQFGYDPKASYAIFYGSRGQDALGNFYILPKNLVYNGVTANNSEALYQASKFTDPAIKAKFNNLTPLQSFYLARKLSKYVRKDWFEINIRVMHQILQLKFAIPALTLILLSTGSKYLVEHNVVKGRDSFWSDAYDGTGQNHLGLVLMRIRAEYLGTGIVEKPADYLTFLATKCNKINKIITKKY